jgi:hypothetical protein
LAAGAIAAIVHGMSFVDHDFILASLARDTIERALRDAARDRLARQARGVGAEDATAGPSADRALTPARSETR